MMAMARGAFERALCDVLQEHGVHLVALAGFMRILSAAFVARWQDRLLNIHPSLLPALRGPLRTPLARGDHEAPPALREWALKLEAKHCILAHHGRREWGAPVVPATREAWCVHLADMSSVHAIESRREGP